MPETRDRSALVLGLVDSWNAGDHERLVTLLAGDAEVRTLRSELENRSYVGPDGLRQAIRDWEDEWEYVKFVTGGATERGDFVVLELRVQSRGKASGVELDVPVWMLWEFRGDEIVRLQSYPDRDGAHGAAGIED